jgi:hypothetical protein
MKPSAHEQLIREIARVAEAAYRRGFVHGHDTATRGEEVVFDLPAWRAKVPLHRSPSPHGRRSSTAEERLVCQCPAIGRVIERLVNPGSDR